jgi:excisionase family DNA binding protein
MTTSETAYLSVAEVAQTLGLSEATVYRRVWDGSLPVVRLSEHGAIRVPRTAIEIERAVHLPPRRSELPGERDVPEAGAVDGVAARGAGRARREPGAGVRKTDAEWAMDIAIDAGYVAWG